MFKVLCRILLAAFLLPVYASLGVAANTRGTQYASSVTDGRRDFDIAKKIMMYWPNRQQFMIMLMRMHKKITKSAKIFWYDDSPDPTWDKINKAAGYADDATDIVVDDASKFTVYDVIKITRTMEQCLITAIAYDTNTLTVTRAYGTTSAAAITDNDWILNLGNASKEASNAPDAYSNQPSEFTLKTSVIVAVASTLIVIVVSIPAAYYTARFRFPGRMAFLLLVLVTQMFSPTALVVGIYREWFNFNMVNTYGALILTNAAFNLAFAVWILHGFFASIPKEVEEAANLDGCSRFGTMRRVMLPLTLPGVVTALIFTFIAAWNEYVVALTLMIDEDKKPLTVGITSYVTGYEQHWDQLFAAAIIAIVPVVILFAFIEKHLVGGLTAGSVK
jgi:multiple sugar transport system permease protein